MNCKNLPGISICQTDRSDGSIKYISDLTKLDSPTATPFSQVVDMAQVHSAEIKIADQTHIGTMFESCDGLLTNQIGLWLVISHADCLPLILHDPKRHILTALHVGWRGAVAGIVPKAIAKMSLEFDSQPKDLSAYFGPCIRPCCYKFSDEPTQSQDPAWSDFVAHHKDEWSIDLSGFVASALINLGVLERNLHDKHLCTAHENSFFSHYQAKQSHQPNGLMATIVQLT